MLTVDTTADDEDDGCDVGHCTLREALRDTRPRFIVFNTPGSVFQLRKHEGSFEIELRAEHSFVAVYGQTAPAGVEIANGYLKLDRGFRHGVFQHLKLRTGIWDGADNRKTVRGCNAWAWRADGAPGTCGLEPGRDDRQACEALPCNHRRACSRREVADYEKRSRCNTCDGWRASRPDDWRGCSDAQLQRAGIGDGFRFRLARHVIFDHVSISWFHDEGIAINGGPAGDLTIQNSIVGAGHVSSSLHPGHRERPHNLNAFLIETSGPLEGVSVHHNLFLHSFSRNPKLQGGVRIEWRNNVHYNEARVAQIFGATCQYDVADNLFRLGPAAAGNRVKQGYCLPEGKIPCGRGPRKCPGACSRDVWPFARAGGGPRVRAVGSLYLAGNVFQEHAAGGWRDLPGIAARGYTPRFDEEWDRLVLNGARWKWWQERRRTPGEQPAFPIEVEPASDLWESLEPHVGASRPARDSIDRALLESVRQRGDVPARALPYTTREPHFAYADARGPVRRDRDGDGLPDGWEEAHGHLDPERKDSLRDEDGDGYLEIEEWACGLDPGSDSGDAVCTGPQLPGFTETEPPAPERPPSSR